MLLLIKSLTLDKLASLNPFRSRDDACTRFLEAQFSVLSDYLPVLLECVANTHEGRMLDNFAETYRHEFVRDYYPNVEPALLSGILNSMDRSIIVTIASELAKAPYDLRAGPAGKPLVVFFEQKNCKECAELHRDVLAQAATLEQMRRFRVFRFDRWSDTALTSPEGNRTTARAWADQLNIAYTPSAVFFDHGKEVMRIEAMLRGFHVQSVMDYVASGAYRNEPSFQRFIQARAERLRDSGVKVDLWK